MSRAKGATSSSLDSKQISEHEWPARDLNIKSPTNTQENPELLAEVQALVEKERKLMELQLLEKDRELQELRDSLEAKREGQRQSMRMKQRRNTFEPDESKSSDPQLYRVADLYDSEEEDDIDDDVDDEVSEGELGMYTDLSGVKLDLGNTEMLEKLTALHLSRQGVNDPMIERLGKAIVHVPTLQILDLSYNDLGDSCTGLLAQILSNRAVMLKELYLQGNRLHLIGAQTLGKALLRNEVLECLNLSDNPFADDPDAGRVLGELFGTAKNSLRSLTISLGDPRHDRSSLTKKGNTATFIMRVMSAHCNITSLGMCFRSLPKAAVVTLASEGLSTAYLRELDLSMAFIGSTGAVSIAKAMIRAQNTMGGLDVQDPKFQAKLREATRENFHLLEKLVLRMNAIGSLGASWLAKAIASSFTLKYIDLSSNELTDTSAGQLASALLNTEAPLYELNLARNKFYRADLDNSQTGAERLCEAVKLKTSLRSLGPSEHLFFSINMRKRLYEALQVDRGISADAEDTENNVAGAIEVYNQAKRVSLQSLCVEPTDRSVDICEVTLPPALGDEFDTLLLWETDPPMEWRVLRERRNQVVGEAKADVISAGDSHQNGHLVASTQRGDPRKSWMQYEVSTKGWRSGDKLIIELRPDMKSGPGHSMWKGTYMQKLSVRAIVENKNQLKQVRHVSPSPRGHKSSDVASASVNTRTSRLTVIQERNWELETSILVDGRNAANSFHRLHDFYVHAGTRRGSLQLEWNIRIEKVGTGSALRDRRTPNGGILGMQWRITKNGSASTALLGDEDLCRVTNLEKALDYVQFKVSLEKLDVFVGDTLALWVRLPEHVLHRVRGRQLFTLRSTSTRLLHMSPPFEASERHDEDENLPPVLVSLNLAGPDPFRLENQITNLWA